MSCGVAGWRERWKRGVHLDPAAGFPVGMLERKGWADKTEERREKRQVRDIAETRSPTTRLTHGAPVQQYLHQAPAVLRDIYLFFSENTYSVGDYPQF